MTLGDIIKNYRKEHHLSMDAFSEKSGISKAYVSLLEKNKRPGTNKPIAPSIQCIKQAAIGMNMDFNLLFSMIDGNVTIPGDLDDSYPVIPSNRIKVFGTVPAGIPIEAIEDVVDWEDIPNDWISGGQEYFGLKVKGDSMYPKYLDGDTIIVRKQSDCESGQDCVVYVNGYDATLKKVVKKPDCIILQPLNPTYDPKVYDYNDESNPVTIAGVVIEIRRTV